MKTNLSALAIALIACTVSFNLSAQTQPASDGGRADLKTAATAKDVQEELDSPDGVALQLLPDGGFRIYGRGSGSYDFNEADEIRGATQDATLRAKAAIVEFLKQGIQSAKSMDNTSIKMKQLAASSGANPTAQISKTDVQTRVEQIASQANAVLSGLVTISVVKKPIGNGGEIQVTMGWSSKTQATAEAVRAGKPIPANYAPSSGQVSSGTNAVGTLNTENLPETKKSNTDL